MHVHCSILASRDRQIEADRDGNSSDRQVVAIEHLHGPWSDPALLGPAHASSQLPHDGSCVVAASDAVEPVNVKGKTGDRLGVSSSGSNLLAARQAVGSETAVPTPAIEKVSRIAGNSKGFGLENKTSCKRTGKPPTRLTSFSHAYVALEVEIVGRISVIGQPSMVAYCPVSGNGD